MQTAVWVMKRPIYLIVICLLLTAILPLFWHFDRIGIDLELEPQIKKMVDSIKTVQMRYNYIEEIKLKRLNATIHDKFAWMIQNNTLPNYFQQTDNSKKLYKNNNIVFLHHPRAAGSSIMKCIENLTQGTLLNFSPVMDSNRRYEWENKPMYKSPKFRSNLKIHRGKFSFGLCNGLQSNCSNFILIRDPLMRSLSSYQYCKTFPNDELCLVADANSMSVKEWIIHQGSLLLQQLTFNPDSCKSDPDIDYETEPKSLHTGELPCWYKHRLFLKNLNEYDYSIILDYVVNNVHKWFGVVGLYEDFQNSLELFQHVYQIPLLKCPSLQILDTKKYIKNNKANRRKRKDDDDVPSTDYENYLEYDSDVKEALKADIKIYNSLKSMYAIQKQIHFNSLKYL